MYQQLCGRRAFPPAAGTEYDHPIPVYLCPSAQSEPTNPHYNGYATASYAVVHGGNFGSVSDEATQLGNGIFGENSTTTFDEISDGTSNTVMVGERRMTDTGAAAGIWMRSINRGGTAGDGTAVAGVCHRTAMLNEFTNPDAFSSAHKGGSHFGLADGSTRFISDTISAAVYERLAGISDGVTDEF